MKVLALTVVLLAAAASSDAQLWKYSQQLFNPFAWIRQGKTGDQGKAPTTIGLDSLGVATTANVNVHGNALPPATKTPIPLPLSYPAPSSPVPAPVPSPSPLQSSSTSSSVVVKSTAAPQSPQGSEVTKQETEEKLESKMDEIDLAPAPSPVKVKVTQPPITTTNAKSPRTTLSERNTSGSTTRRALKVKSTTSPLASPSSYYSHSTRHQTPTPTQGQALTQDKTHTSPIWTTVPITTHHRDSSLSSSGAHTHSTLGQGQGLGQSASVSGAAHSSSQHGTTAALRPSAAVTEATSAHVDTTTQEATGTTEEPRDNHRQHDFYLSKREKPQVKIAANISQNLLPLPAGASAALVKPTKYHYYPHNQHIYLLPECAIQQVCNAVYVRLNWTQPLCACPSRYRDPCSASLNSDDQHTTELQVDRNSKRALTLVKTCEPTTDMRVCRAPRDWSLLALQNIRTGKSHYLVICRCPDTSILEGPMSHDQPTYASVPGIRVYGMMCVPPPAGSSPPSGANKRRGRPLRLTRSIDADPPFPWDEAAAFAKTADWED